MSQTENGIRNTTRRWLGVILVGSWVIQTVLILAVPYPPLQDYPNHLMLMHARENLEVVPVYLDHLTLDSGFRPNMLTESILGMLRGPFSLEIAGKLTLAILLGFAFLAMWLYQRRFAADFGGALIAAHVLTSWMFLKGLLNCYLAVGFGLVLLTLWWPPGRERPTWPALVGATATWIALVATHGFVFLAFGAIAGGTAVLLHRRSPRNLLPRLATLVPAVALFLFFLRGQAETIASNEFVYSGGLKSLLIWKPLTMWQRFQPTLSDPTAWLSYCLLCLGGLGAVRSGVLRNKARDECLLVSFAAVAVALYLVLPDALSDGWGHMKQRISYIGVLVATPLVARIMWPRLRAIGLGALGILVPAMLIATTLDYAQINEETTVFVELERQLPRGALVLTVDLTPLGQPLRPHLHAWAYICMERDCLTPYLFAKRAERQLYFTDRPPVPPQGETAPSNWEDVAEVALTGGYDAVLIRGRSPDGERVLRQKLRLVGENRMGLLFLTGDLEGSRATARPNGGRSSS